MKSRSQIQREIKIAREGLVGMSVEKILARHKDLTAEELAGFIAAHRDFITDPDDMPGALGDYVRECQGIAPIGAAVKPPADESDTAAVLAKILERLDALEAPKRGPGRPKKQATE